MGFRSLLSRLPRSFRVLLITTAVAVVGVLVLYHWLLPDQQSYKAAPWLPQVVVTLLGLVGASWFAYRRIMLLEEQLAATERGNLNGAIKEADDMMSKSSLSSIIAGQRWLHDLAEDDRFNPGFIRSLVCAHIASSDPVLTSHDANTDSIRASNEIKRRARQAALDMVFRSPGRDRYFRCQDKPELGWCTWRGLDFTDLHVVGANFRKGDFTDARISGACFDESDLRETTWGGIVIGGSARTSMCSVQMCGAHASSCIFENIDFTDANMGNNGLATRFIHCTFKYCNFEGAIWSGTEFDTPYFYRCTGITYDLCRDAKLKNPAGLPEDVLDKLRRMRVGGY